MQITTIESTTTKVLDEVLIPFVSFLKHFCKGIRLRSFINASEGALVLHEKVCNISDWDETAHLAPEANLLHLDLDNMRSSLLGITWSILSFWVQFRPRNFDFEISNCHWWLWWGVAGGFSLTLLLLLQEYFVLGYNWLQADRCMIGFIMHEINSAQLCLITVQSNWTLFNLKWPLLPNVMQNGFLLRALEVVAF